MRTSISRAAPRAHSDVNGRALERGSFASHALAQVVRHREIAQARRLELERIRVESRAIISSAARLIALSRDLIARTRR